MEVIIQESIDNINNYTLTYGEQGYGLSFIRFVYNTSGSIEINDTNIQDDYELEKLEEIAEDLYNYINGLQYKYNWKEISIGGIPSYKIDYKIGESPPYMYDPYKIINKAIKENNIDVIKENFDKLSAIEKDNTLIEAIRNNNLNIIKLLIKLGVDGTKKEALDEAITQKNLPIIIYLVNKGARPNDNSILIAVKGGSLKIVKYLVSLSNISNEQIVQWASEFGHLTIIKYFVNTKNASVTANDNYAIYIAGENEHLSVVKFLIRKGADIKKIRNPKTLSRIIGWLMITNTKYKPNMDIKFSASELLSAETNFQIKSGQFKSVLLLEKNPKNSEAFAYSAIESIEKFNPIKHTFNKFTVLRKDLIKMVPTIKSELLKTIYNIKPVNSVTSLQHKDKRFISGTIVSKHNFKEGLKNKKKITGLNQITDINTELKTNLLDIAKTMGLIETQMEQLHFMSFDIKTQKRVLSIWVNSIM